jgi:hypothetical protein
MRRKAIEGLAVGIFDGEPPAAPETRLVTDLEDICRWLGTYQERLRLAHADERVELAGHVHRWSNRLRERRAELA